MGIRSLAAEFLPSALQGLQRAVSAPAPSKNAQADSFGELSDKLGYLSKADQKKVLEAYKFADEAHLGQFRARGEPYITHPVAVAGLCADWKLDVQAIMAALMHDAMEDCGITKPELIERFGAPTAELVDGLTKLDKLHFSTREQGQAESFRKMLLAMARDVRVILIKLADRLHNMRTMQAVAPDKRQRIARETLDIYAPIAHRLGLNQSYRELQELSFEFLLPVAPRRAGQGGAARARPSARHRRAGAARCGKGLRQAQRSRSGVGAREDGLFDLPQDARKARRLRAGAATSSVSASSSPRSRSVIWRSACCTSCTSRCRGASRTISPSRKPTATSRCTPRWSVRWARRWSSRSAPTRCMRWPRRALPRTGCTRSTTRTPTTPATRSAWGRCGCSR